MVTKGKQWWTFEVLGPSMIYNGYNCSKYALNFKFPIITLLNQWLLWATNGNQGQKVMDIWSSETISQL